ncbi:hypothetical protein RB597_001267 [Gaeumannomyces tritici]
MANPYRDGEFAHAFNQQDHQTQQAWNALATTIPPPPFRAEWGYAHGTSDQMWPPEHLGGEPEHDYVEQVVVLVQGLPAQAARGDILSAARVLTGDTGSSFGIHYVTITQPGTAYVYCADVRKAAGLAELLSQGGFPPDLNAKPAPSSSSSGGSSRGQKSSSGGKQKSQKDPAAAASASGKARVRSGPPSSAPATQPSIPLYTEHCAFKISSQFLQHLQEVRFARGNKGPEKVRQKWEESHPSGRPKPSKR